jgi:hypothetical protein
MMYSPPASPKKQAIRLAFVYAAMTIAVLVTVFILILIMLGYRFDRVAGTLEQGGLVQLGSIPSGANLTIDGTRLGATTSTKTTLMHGQHTIMMSRNGYSQWQKTVDVKSGSILWLNYARLIPVDLPVEDVTALPAVTSTLPSPDRKWIAMTTVKTSPVISLFDISGDVPVLKTLTLPELLYTKPSDETNQSFSLARWHSSSRYLLVEHRYDDKKEWIVVDTEDMARSRNITTIFDVEASQVEFSRSDGHILYALMNGDVRKIDTEAETISAPLVRNIAEFSLYDRSTIVYTTVVDEATKSRSVGYRQDNASSPRVIRTYSDDGLIPLHISIDNEYYNQTYVAIAYGSAVEILTGNLPKSDSNDPLSLTAVATMSTPETVTALSNRTDGRFFVAEHGKSYSVYDLELQKATTTNLRGDMPAVSTVGWLDGYTVWNGDDGKLRLYEFDGANQHDMMSIIPGQHPALTPNNRYLYAPTVDEKGAFHLSRVQLIL